MDKELVNLIAKRFIQRRDVKAVQFPNGAYSPDYKLQQIGRHGPRGFQRKHLEAHLSGKSTYGHYVLDADSLCKVITFDVDLISLGVGNYYDFDNDSVVISVNPRELWEQRRNAAARKWYKYQLRMLAQKLCGRVQELGLATAAAYSGHKGVHVYAFLDKPIPGDRACHGAQLILDMFDDFEPLKGHHLFRHKNPDPVQGFRNLTVEVYPKQESLDGKTLGNLVRLPLGVNLKAPKDPTFFLDFTAPMTELRPHQDPVGLLKEGDPFRA